jgi:hypothetical protein
MLPHRPRRSCHVACLVLALLVSGCLVQDDDAVMLGTRRLPVPVLRLAAPFAQLSINSVEATFERQGDDLRVYLRCTEAMWSPPRHVSAGTALITAHGASGGSGPIDCPGGLLPGISGSNDGFAGVQPGDSIWVGLDVEDPPGRHTRKTLGFVVLPDGRLQEVPGSVATPAWWK